jgi:hypothetical protein
MDFIHLGPEDKFVMFCQNVGTSVGVHTTPSTEQDIFNAARTSSVASTASFLKWTVEDLTVFIYAVPHCLRELKFLPTLPSTFLLINYTSILLSYSVYS